MASAVASFDHERATELVSGLRAAFNDGISRPIAWRIEQLESLKRLIQEHETDFLHALHQDFRKCAMEGWFTETGFVVGEIDHVLRHLSGWLQAEKVATPLINQPGRSYIVHEPLGVVLIIAPWNYPLQLVLAPLIGALAAGNCAVLKPSELAPATTAAIARYVPEYLDRRAICVVEGGPHETTALLAQQWDHIFFTGGEKVARIVMEAASKHLTPVTLELGGKCPCIIHADADLTVAVRRVAWAKYLNAGQTCVAPDYVLVERTREGQFLSEMAETVRAFYGDDPQTSADYPRIINERHFARLTRMLDSGRAIVGGETDAEERYIAPTVLTDVRLDGLAMQEEIFGPILPVLSYDSFDEALQSINSRPKPLALYLFAKDRALHDRVVASTSSGNVCINDCIAHMAVPDLPFGGVGASGFGAYHGRHTFETFSHRKGVLSKSTRVDPPLRYPPYTENKLRWAKRLV